MNFKFNKKEKENKNKYMCYIFQHFISSYIIYGSDICISLAKIRLVCVKLVCK